jgi:hypothetical protein
MYQFRTEILKENTETEFTEINSQIQSFAKYLLSLCQQAKSCSIETILDLILGNTQVQSTETTIEINEYEWDDSQLESSFIFNYENE